MYTIKFFFTESATFKATNVVDISVDRDTGILTYIQEAHNEDRTIAGRNIRAIDMDDLLYAVVKEKEDGEITIIAGLYDSFEVVPVGAAVQRQKNIEAEAARVKAYREEKAPQRNAKEAEKYAARRAARKAQYLNGESETQSTVEGEAVPAQENVVIEPSFNAQTPAPTKSHAKRTVVDELSAAGLDQNSIEALKSLDILK